MSAFSKNTSELISSLSNSGGLSRPNRFAVQLNLPNTVNIPQDLIDRVDLNCSSAIIPGRSVATFEHNTSGWVQHKIPHSEMYGELQLQFYLSDDLAEKRIFDLWHDSMFDPIFGNINYYEDVVGGLEIAKLDQNDNVVASYYVHEAFPLNVGDIELSYQNMSQFINLPVTFAFYQWELLSS
jgi:hypothetical protein